uniref:Uncharacterized protein n=1 Tax=Romanomermis culicivorax TaxID=13658 RepID=A0A915J0B3_ROMCU
MMSREKIQAATITNKTKSVVKHDKTSIRRSSVIGFCDILWLRVDAGQSVKASLDQQRSGVHYLAVFGVQKIHYNFHVTKPITDL